METRQFLQLTSSLAPGASRYVFAGQAVHGAVPTADLKKPGSHGVHETHGGVVHSSPLSQGKHCCTSALKDPWPLYTAYPNGQSCSRKTGPATVQLDSATTTFTVALPWHIRPVCVCERERILICISYMQMMYKVSISSLHTYPAGIFGMDL